MNDPTPQQLAGLSPTLQPIAIEIINLFRDAGIPLGIVALGGRRTSAQQSNLVGKGVSATLNSYHLTGDAFDVDVLGFPRDQIPPQFWNIYGQVVESYGLVWGGRWSQPYDPAHAQLPKALKSA